MFILSRTRTLRLPITFEYNGKCQYNKCLPTLCIGEQPIFKYHALYLLIARPYNTLWSPYVIIMWYMQSPIPAVPSLLIAQTTEFVKKCWVKYYTDKKYPWLRPSTNDYGPIPCCPRHIMAAPPTRILHYFP